MIRAIAALAALLLATPLSAQLVIAHRGASGERPEHTLAAYERAIDQGADFIEPDLVPTRDGVLVATHDNNIALSTDVAQHPEFADRKTTRMIDGENQTGWFTEDFTLAELRTLRVRELFPAVRKANTRFDGLYQIPTFAEIVQLVRAKEAETGRAVGLYPEIKHPMYFSQRGVDLVEMLIRDLEAAGLNKPGAKVILQCFEVGPLERLDKLSPLPLIQLVAGQRGPPDKPGLTFAAMLTPAGLKTIAGYADGIGAQLTQLLDPQGKPLPLIAEAHAARLKVHGWTLRRENLYMPAALRIGSDPAASGDFGKAWKMIQAAGIDGVFTDNPGSVPRRR
jgi:glycerophosphoryl diester phosphodiesterase